MVVVLVVDLVLAYHPRGYVCDYGYKRATHMQKLLRAHTHTHTHTRRHTHTKLIYIISSLKTYNRRNVLINYLFW